MHDIEKALNLWVEITGVDPNAKSFRCGEYDIYKIHKELNESLELDPSSILTMLLLDYYTERYLNERCFNVNEIMTDFQGLMAYLNKAQELYALLRTPEIRKIRSDFEEHMIVSIKQYGDIHEKVLKTIGTPHDLAFLRRDALKSIKKLTVAQFSQGDPDNRPVKFLNHVYEFWNINSLIRMVQKTNEPFISVNLIRDPDGYSSYFVFAIKNGQTMSILCDKPHWIHPLQKTMTRRPERRFAERIFMNHFPYDLMDIEFDEDMRAAYFAQQSNSTDLVVFQDDVHKLREIKDLKPTEVIWITMMFQLIVEKFWKEGFKAKELSYTGEMITINTDRSKELMIPNRLVIPQYTAAEITIESTKDNWKRKPVGHHEWMERRYEDKIPPDAINVLERANEVKYLTAGDVTNVQSIGNKEMEKIEFRMTTWDKPIYKLAGLEPMDFGTKEELTRDYEWYARYNKARAIQVLANEEYQEREKDVKAWYKKRVTKNSEMLLNYIATGELVIVHTDEYEERILRFSKREHCAGVGSVRLHGGLFDGKYDCFINGSIASIAAVFEPQTSIGLATLCGCKVHRLPDVIRNWRRDDPHNGNHLLDRLDPMDWALTDPWRKYKFEVVVYLSIRSYNKICKQHGTDPKAPYIIRGKELNRWES